MKQLTRTEATEARLVEWGRECRDRTHRLGLPEVSNIATMADHIRAETRLQKDVRKKKLQKGDAKTVAQAHGFVEQDVTAKGKETRSFVLPKTELNSYVMQVDQAVAQLPRWAQRCVNRKYLYGEPDRIAANRMRMPKGEYAQRCRAAVELVAERLDERYIQRHR